MAHVLTIKGRIPSKKNSVIAMCRGGRAIHIPSNKYREWHKDASAQLIGQKLDFKGRIELLFFAPDKRAGDLSNKADSVMDLLVDNGFLEDDNWFIVPELSLKFGGVDTENPRVEIYV